MRITVSSRERTAPVCRKSTTTPSACLRRPPSTSNCAQPSCATGTAHACGTLVTGRDPATSVVDPFGKVHGLENCYVVDGSVLPRSSRVNPALTIYAWALRVASRLGARGESNEHTNARPDPVRA
ncbi:MAG: GMC oxidoreductase [Burkholderiales bacterium]